MSVHEDSDSDSEVNKNEPVESSVAVQSLENIYASIRAAHENRIGAITLSDCKTAKDHYNTLQASIDGIMTKKEISISQEAIDAYQFLRRVLDIQSQKGSFSFDGSIALYEQLSLLEKWVNQNKSPSLKLKELKNAKKENRSRK